MKGARARSTLLAALLITALAPAGRLGAQATLDFSGLGLSDGQQISPSYGTGFDNATVTNQARLGFGNTATKSPMCYWSSAYSGLSGVAYACQSGLGVGEFAFAADAGHEVFLQSLQIGSWLDVPRTVSVRVYDWSWALLYSSTSVVGSTPVTFTPNVSSVQGLYLQYGDSDPFNTGIDNITFRVDPTVTPEPVSMALLGTGLAGLGAVRRRRRRESALA